MSKKSPGPRVQVPVRLPEATHERFQRLLHHTGRTAQAALELALVAWMKQVEAAENGGRPFGPIPG